MVVLSLGSLVAALTLTMMSRLLNPRKPVESKSAVDAPAHQTRMGTCHLVSAQAQIQMLRSKRSAEGEAAHVPHVVVAVVDRALTTARVPQPGVGTAERERMTLGHARVVEVVPHVAVTVGERARKTIEGHHRHALAGIGGSAVGHEVAQSLQQRL